MTKSTFMLCTLCWVLGGCSLTPHYEPPQMTVPDAFRDQEMWQQAIPSDQLARGKWWELYGDPTLDQLEAQIDTANPTLAAALDRYTQARALSVEARASLFPVVNASGQATRNRQSDNRPLRSATQPNDYDDVAVGGSFNYEIDLWGRVRNEAFVGSASAQAVAADSESIRLSLHAELATSYLALRGVDAEIKLLTDTTNAYNKAVELTRTRHEGGIASGLDVSRAQTQLDSTQAQLTDRRALRALLEHAIASLVGMPATQFSLTPAEVSVNTPDVPVTVPSTLLQRRPDISAAERRAAVANAGIGIARAAYFPRLSLGAIAGFENTANGELLAAPNRVWSIGPQAVLTLFDSGRRAAEVTRAKAHFDEAADEYRAVVLSAFEQVEDELVLLRLLSQEALEQDEATMAAEHTLQLALNRYQEGAVNYLDVVVAQAAALQAERTTIELRTRRLQASVRLVRALGGGWSTQDLPSQRDLYHAQNTLK